MDELGKNSESLLWGLKDGRLLYIEHVINGLDCGCTCSHCGNLLIAKNKGGKNIHHFAHSSGIDCPKAIESTVHKLAKQVLQTKNILMLPPCKAKGPCGLKEYIPAMQIKFDSVEIEKNIDILNTYIRPDVIGYYNGKRIFVEFCFTHSIDEFKKGQIDSSGVSCVEIMLDVTLQDPFRMMNFLEKSVESRTWIFHRAINRLVSEHRLKEAETLKAKEKWQAMKVEAKERKLANEKRKAYEANARIAKRIKEKEEEEKRKNNLLLVEARKKGSLYLECPISERFLNEFLESSWGNNKVIKDLHKGSWIQNKIFYYWPEQDIDVFINSTQYILVPRKESFDKLDKKQQEYHIYLLKSVEKYSTLFHKNIDCTKCKLYCGSALNYIVCKYKEGDDVKGCLDFDAL